MRKPLKTFPLFKSIDQALTKVYDVMSASGIKTATYGVPTAASSSTDKVSATDRLTEAVWVLEVIKTVLSPVELACVTCTYDSAADHARDSSISMLVEAWSTIHPNPELLREVIIREFDFGETYCKPLIQTAKEFGVHRNTATNVSIKVRAQLLSHRASIDRKLRTAFEPRGWIRAADRLAA